MKGLLSVFVISSALLAGCTNPAPGHESDAPPALEATPRGPLHGIAHVVDGVVADLAGIPRAIGAQFFTGYVGLEPTLGITSDGTLFTHAEDPGDGPPLVIRSRDQGRTWDDVTPAGIVQERQHPWSFDPYLFVDAATDRVYWNDNTLACSFLSWSDDGGETWTFNPAACGTPTLHDHQTLGVAQPRRLPTMGYPNVLYFCSSQGFSSSCSTSLDGGATFGPTVPVYGAQDVAGIDPVCEGPTGHVQADVEGRMFLPAACNTTHVAATEDDGLTWERRIIDAAHPPAPGEHDVGLGVDEANNLYAAWQGQDGFLWMARSRDHGVTWSPPWNVTAPGVTATHFSAVAGGAPGRVALAYIGTTIDRGYQAFKEEGNCQSLGPAGTLCTDPVVLETNATWNAYLTLVLEADTDQPRLVSVTANDPADPLARGACGRSRCNGMYDFIDVEIDPEGRPWASFVDVCTTHCVRDANLSSDQPPQGFLGTLLEGPALRGAPGTILEPLPPAPVPSWAATQAAGDLVTVRPHASR